MVYTSLVHSKFTYGLLVWWGVGNLNNIFLTQKEAIQATSVTVNLFKMFSILKIEHNYVEKVFVSNYLPMPPDYLYSYVDTLHICQSFNNKNHNTIHTHTSFASFYQYEAIIKKCVQLQIVDIDEASR